MLRNIKVILAYIRVFLRRTGLSALRPAGLKKYVLALIFLTLAVIGIGLVDVRLKDQQFRPKITEGVVGTYTGRDLPPVVTHLLSRGLFTQNASGEAIPDLAESVAVNPEGTQYTIKLKPRLYWADQTPVRSTDIPNMFTSVNVSYPDERTIVYKLSEPYSPFLGLLSKPLLKNDGLVGVGPYYIRASYQNRGVISKLELKSLKRELPDVNVIFYPTENTAKVALELGNIQAVIGASDIPDLSGQKTFKLLFRQNLSQLVAIFYNTKDRLLGDDNLRLALSFAAPSIPGEMVAQTPLPPNSWAFNGNVKDYLDNPEAAKAALARVKNGPREPIVLTSVESLKQVAYRVVESWNKQGIKAVVKVESGVPQNFQALLITKNIPVDPDQYALWHSTQTQTNISHVSNPRIDKDLEDGRKTTDVEKRKAAYRDFQKTLLDHAPATFLYFARDKIVYNRKVESQLMKVIDLQLPGY